MNERIKKLRKALGLTQQEFGDRIGIKRNTLANYEIGRNEPIDAVTSLICREFNVNEAWLRTGAEPMFLPTQEESLDELFKQHSLGSLERQIILEFIKLESKDRQAIITFVRNLSKHISQDEEPAQTAADKKAAYMKMAEDSYDSEQEQETQASSAKESVVG